MMTLLSLSVGVDAGFGVFPVSLASASIGADCTLMRTGG